MREVSTVAANVIQVYFSACHKAVIIFFYLQKMKCNKCQNKNINPEPSLISYLCILLLFHPPPKYLREIRLDSFFQFFRLSLHADIFLERLVDTRIAQAPEAKRGLRLRKGNHIIVHRSLAQIYICYICGTIYNTRGNWKVMSRMPLHFFRALLM